MCLSIGVKTQVFSIAVKISEAAGDLVLLPYYLSPLNTWTVCVQNEFPTHNFSPTKTIQVSSHEVRHWETRPTDLRVKEGHLLKYTREGRLRTCPNVPKQSFSSPSSLASFQEYLRPNGSIRKRLNML